MTWRVGSATLSIYTGEPTGSDRLRRKWQTQDCRAILPGEAIIMTDRLKKDELARQLAARMNTDEATATAWLDGIVETLYESFKKA